MLEDYFFSSLIIHFFPLQILWPPTFRTLLQNWNPSTFRTHLQNCWPLTFPIKSDLESECTICSSYLYKILTDHLVASISLYFHLFWGQESAINIKVTEAYFVIFCATIAVIEFFDLPVSNFEITSKTFGIKTKKFRIYLHPW